MKKRLAVIGLGVMLTVALTACGSPKVTESTVELKKDGKLIEYTIEDFSASHYDTEEFKSFVEYEVADYLEGSDAEIKISKAEVDEETQVVNLTMQYDSVDTFVDFNGIECFSGSILQAQSAGYDFAVDFISTGEEPKPAKAEESLSADGDEIQGMIPNQMVLQDDDLKAFIIREAVDVIVPGTVYYVSGDNTTIVDKSLVKYTGQTDANGAPLIYVLYK